jgi:hypothetical protein
LHPKANVKLGSYCGVFHFYLSGLSRIFLLGGFGIGGMTAGSFLYELGVTFQYRAVLKLGFLLKGWRISRYERQNYKNF